MGKNESEETNIALTQKMNELKVEIDAMDVKNALIIKSEQCNDAKRDEMEKEIVSLREEKNALIVSCKDMEVHINDIRREYEEYKQSMNGLEDKLCTKYENEQNEKDKLYDENLQKAVEQHQSLKNEIDAIIENKEAEIKKIQNENGQHIQKYNNLHKIHEQNLNELDDAKKKIEELLCNNDNIKDQNDFSNEMVHAIHIESNNKALIDKNRTTPHSAANSMDFSNEIHDQLKDENIAQKNTIDSLENEMNKIAKDLQIQTQTIQELQSENQALSENFDKIKQEKDEKAKKLNKYSQSLKTAMQKLKQFKSEKASLQSNLDDLQTKYDELNAAKAEIESTLSELEKELKSSRESEEISLNKLEQLAVDQASKLERNQILQMEHDQIVQQNKAHIVKISELEQMIANKESEKEKLKQKYKAYINKQKKEVNQANEKINSMSPKLEKLQSLKQSHNELQQRHNELSKEYESKSIMVNEYE